eukprot:TRINITY_DN3215_c0_g2_i9.p1 TRINITY_DN3215_c0_g2~~TRINITY_DN3215_c0_g2_i9.p1  ORF type:complete len:276 (-),score=44.21 TRINITY_DN3215_c0_g2_i9:11-838(-)
MLAQCTAGGIDHVVDLGGQQTPQGFEQQSTALQAAVLTLSSVHVGCDQGNFTKLLESDQARTHAVVDIVRVVGNLVGKVAQLRLQTGLRAIEETTPDTAGLMKLERLRVASGAVLEDAFPRLETEIQSFEAGIALLEPVHDSQRLEVVLESRSLRIDASQAPVQLILTCMPERGVPQVMRQGNGFREVFVELQGTRNRTRELRHLERVREPRPEQVALVVQEDLGLVDEATERCGMDDAIAVALVIVPGRLRRAGQIGRAVQQECRDRSRMPSSA